MRRLIDQLELNSPEDSLAIQGSANISHRLASKVLAHIHAQAQPDIKRVKVHVRRKELESVDNIRFEREILAVLLRLEMLATLSCVQTRLARQEECRVFVYVLAPGSQRHVLVV